MKKKKSPSLSKKKLPAKRKVITTASSKKRVSKKETKALTKKLEAELKQLYDAFFESMFNANLRKYKSFLAEDFKQIGSTLEEVWFSKNEVAKYYKASLEPVAGNIEFRNRDIRMETVDKLILITEQADCYVNIDGVWVFYDKVRISSLLQKINTNWKFIQQHISVPDNRTEEGETIALEKISKENLELRDAVKRRTVELEDKYRELEIEAAVERVRAKALAMHKSEEIIDVVSAMRGELDGLKISGITSATIILSQENGLRLWDITSVIEREDGFHFSMDILFTLDGTKPNDWIRRVWDGTEKYFVIRQDSKSIKRTIAWTGKYKPEFAENAQRFLETHKVRNAWHPVVQLSHGKLSLDLLQEPIVEVQSILTKMGAAFDLVYKRFLDLQKAESQAREAKIETALEKIRSRSLAMHKSDELWEVVAVVFEKFQELKFSIDGAAFIATFIEGSRAFNCWLASDQDQSYPTILKLPEYDTPTQNDLWVAKQAGLDFFSKTK